MKKIVDAVLIITILFGCNKNQRNKVLYENASRDRSRAWRKFCGELYV
jgi:uncharacterized lipoprotein NlpE involved in copper resistance